MRKEILQFLLVLAEWSSLVTGAFSAVLVLLGLGISVAEAFGVKIPANPIIQLATWFFAAICGGYAAFSVWRRERLAKEALNARLTPKIAISYDPTKSQCRSISTFTDQFGRNPKDGMCFRLEISNIGPETIPGCEGHLTEISYEGEKPELAPMNLTWVASAPGISSVDIRSTIESYLDVAVIDADNRMRICSLGWPNNKGNFFERQGNYIFKVAVSARNSATTPPFYFRLVFNGNWKTSKIEMIAK
jgi:hypothetical protein